MGTTITAAEDGNVSGLIQPTSVPDDDPTTPPIPAPVTYQMPANFAAPNNATICIPPDPRNDLPRDTASLDGDSPLLNPASIFQTNPGPDELDNGSEQAQLTQANPIVPRTDTPNHGDPTPTAAL